jgi:hypothetical protein
MAATREYFFQYLTEYFQRRRLCAVQQNQWVLLQHKACLMGGYIRRDVPKSAFNFSLGEAAEPTVRGQK